MYLSGVLGLAPAIKGNEVGSWLSPGHRRNVRCLNFVNGKPFKQDEKRSWQCKCFLTKQVKCDLWIMENWLGVQPPCKDSFKSESEHSQHSSDKLINWQWIKALSTFKAQNKQLTVNQNASPFTIITCSKEKQKRRRKKVHKILYQTTQTRLDPGSLGYLPDIYSGLTLGLISGWKPPNAGMARKFLSSGARLAVMAQRAGCTAFNPWHEGLPGSVWKH